MGYPVWRFNRYIRVLKNRLYLGEIKYSGKFYKGVHEPIISEEQYNRVQKIMENHKGTNYNKTKNALLVGLIKCGCCGNNFVSYSTSTQAKTVYRYYVCRARRFPSEYIKKCTNRIMRRDTIEKFVIDELLNFEYAVNQREQNHADIDYDTLIAKIDKKISNALELYTDNRTENFRAEHARRGGGRSLCLHNILTAFWRKRCCVPSRTTSAGKSAACPLIIWARRARIYSISCICAAAGKRTSARTFIISACTMGFAPSFPRRGKARLLFPMRRDLSRITRRIRCFIPLCTG